MFRKHKFGAKRTEHAGISFASKFEAHIYSILKLREKAGEIRILKIQDHVKLTEAEILYIPDFKCEYVSSGEIFWSEAKGFETPEWKIKKKLWLYYGPGKLEIYTGSVKYFKREEIIPKTRKT